MEFRPVYSSVHSYSYLELLDHKLQSGTICDADANLIKQYISYKIASSSLSAVRSRTITAVLIILRSRYLNCNFVDITDGLWLTAAGLIRSNGLKQNTVSSYLSISKRFLLWLFENHINTNLSHKGIQIVKVPQAQFITKTPDLLLSDNDVQAMLHHPHCKPITAALISILYYTGMRPSEALKLKWSDLEFSNRLLKIRITDTKTGKFRYAPSSEALEYVVYWRNHYPVDIKGGPEGSNPVFVTLKRQKISHTDSNYGSMTYVAARKQIAALSTAALGRRVNLYIFRGSDITNSATKGVPDAVIKAIHWGNQSTSMLSTYLLLKDNQIESAVLKRAGISTNEESAENNSNVLCNKCFTMNSPGSDYCRTCGEPLSKSAIDKVRTMRETGQQQQAEKSVPEMLNDVAEFFGMSLDEFTSKMLKVKNL